MPNPAAMHRGMGFASSQGGLALGSTTGWKGLCYCGHIPTIVTAEAYVDHTAGKAVEYDGLVGGGPLSASLICYLAEGYLK